jgi:hypothetical protein
MGTPVTDRVSRRHSVQPVQRRLTQQHDQVLRLRWQIVQQRKDPIIRPLGTDLIEFSFGPTIQHTHGHVGTHVTDLRVVGERNVLARFTKDHRLDRVSARSGVDAVYRVVAKDLEDEVPKVSSTTDMVEDGRSHGLVLV